MESQTNKDVSADKKYILELESQNKSLQMFIDNTEVGMYVSDYFTGEILYANRKTVELFGVLNSVNEIIGKICWKLVNSTGEGRCPFCKHDKLIGHNGELLPPFTWEHHFSKYGVWVKIISQAIIWTDNRLAQMNTFYDITDSKRLNEELIKNAREREHRKMQQDFQRILDLMPLGVRIHRYRDHAVSYINKASLNLFGCESANDLVDKTGIDFAFEAQSDEKTAIETLTGLSKLDAYDHIFRCRKLSGEQFDVHMTSCNIDFMGEPSVLSVLRDMTVENKFRSVQQSLREVLDMMPIPVRITDQETTEIIYVNEACIKLFDYATPDDMYKLHLTDMLPPFQSDGTESRKRIFDILHSNTPKTMEIEYLTSKGEMIYGRINTCFIEYNKRRKSMLCIITDIAAEKEQLRLLQSAAEKEKAANKLKSSFLSNMSHEVRTPMNAIIGLTEIELSRRCPTECFDVFKKINISAKSLLQIINDILDLSKIEEDKLELFSEEFELEDILNNALLIVLPNLVGKDVELLPDIATDLPRYLIGDKTRLWQVLKNHLDNAAKFTQKGYICLSVKEDTSLSTEDTVFVSFTVKDTGIGLNEQQIRKALLPYEQIYNEAQMKYTGTGLGLPLSKRICELMGGELTLESVPGQGTTIRYTLPFTRSHKNKSETLEISKLEGLKVLILENSEMSLEITETLLKNARIDYVTASCGRDALKIVGQHPHFDIIILDFIAKDGYGAEIAKAIREVVSRDSKILIMAKLGSHIDSDELETYGIDGIIEKPFVPMAFYEKLLITMGNITISETNETEYIPFTNVRILVCEDNDINQAVAGGMLSQFGIVPVFADNGKIGIEILNRNEPFDLILMDLHMPVMDGYETTLAIRSKPEFDNIPIISLTADAMTEVIERCLSNGMNDYLSKPFVMDDFYHMLLKWLPKSKRIT